MYGALRILAEDLKLLYAEIWIIFWLCILPHARGFPNVLPGEAMAVGALPALLMAGLKLLHGNDGVVRFSTLDPDA